MAYTVFQAGSTLYGMDPRGAIKSLTLPTGVALDSTTALRSTIFGRFAVLVNSPSRPISVDANLNVRVLCPNPPVTSPTIAGASGGSLSGTFKSKYTYRVYDANRQLLSESDFSPVPAAVTISSQHLKASGLSISGDAVSSIKLYRTTDGTAVFFGWLDLDGNTQTSVQDDLTDAGLSTLAAPSLGTPPDMYLITEFRSRLFGVAKTDNDNLRYSEIGAMYAWPSDNKQPVPRPGSDSRGITAFLRRRDALGVGRENGIYQFTGTSGTDFRFVNVSEDTGVESADSVAVYKNTVFFVWKDGIYIWDENGVNNISDGKVRRWFTRDDTFNLSRLKNSFAVIDPFRKKYRLFLASAGSIIEDCWIEYDFMTGKFWGPHTSHAMNPSAAFRFAAPSGLMIPAIGATDGFIRLDRLKRTDDTAIAIDFDVVTSRDDASTALDSPAARDEKYFGELTIHNKSQPHGTLVVQTIAGEPDKMRIAENPAESDLLDLTESTLSASRIGVGKAMKVRFRNNEADTDVSLRGYEVTPVHVIGSR